MSLLKLNDHFFIPDYPNWEHYPVWSRSWTTDVGRAISGREKRTSFRSNGRPKLTFTIQPRSLQQWGLFEARAMQALKSGKACCPSWGRALTLNSAVNGIAVELDPESNNSFTAGDFIYFLQPDGYGEERWNARKILSVALNWLTLESAVDQEFPAGAFVWPVFFGSLKVEDFSPVTNHTGPVRLVFGEPVKVIVPPKLACEGDEDGEDGGLGSGSLSRVIVEVEPGTCDNAAKLTWAPIINATSYRIYESVGSNAGPFNQVAHITSEQTAINPRQGLLGYSVQRAFLKDNYYKVRACRGTLMGDFSAEVAVAAIGIEQTCRAMQERYRLGKSLPLVDGESVDWLPWSARLSDSAAAAAYPVNGFYASDIFDGGGAIISDNARNLIQMLMDAMYGGWLGNYAATENPQHVEEIPVHGTDTMPPIAVTTDNMELCLRTVISRLCQLQHVIVAASQTGLSAKNAYCYAGAWGNYAGGESDPFPEAFNRCIACAREALFAIPWGKGRGVGGYTQARFYSGLDCGDGMTLDADSVVSMNIGHHHQSGWSWFPEYSPGHIDWFGYRAGTNAVRGNVTADLTLFPATAKAKLYYFLVLGPRTVNGVEYPRDQWSEAEDVNAPSCGEVWTSEKRVLNSGQPDIARTSSEWNLANQKVLVTMKPENWTYLP